MTNNFKVPFFRPTIATFWQAQKTSAEISWISLQIRDTLWFKVYQSGFKTPVLPVFGFLFFCPSRVKTPLGSIWTQEKVRLLKCESLELLDRFCWFCVFFGGLGAFFPYSKSCLVQCIFLSSVFWSILVGSWLFFRVLLFFSCLFSLCVCYLFHVLCPCSLDVAGRFFQLGLSFSLVVSCRASGRLGPLVCFLSFNEFDLGLDLGPQSALGPLLDFLAF